MKPFKTFGGIVVSFSALFLITSCSKSLDEKAGDREVSKLGSHCGNCGDAIHLNMSNTNPGSNYFWVGDRQDVSGRQTFINSDFTTDQQYFEVTATGGMPYTMQERIGVDNGTEAAKTQNRINVGESLILTLSSCMMDYKLTGFNLVLTGTSTGNIKLYDGATWVHTVPYSNAGGTTFSVEYIASFTTDILPYFTQIVVEPTTGWVNLRGFQPNAVNGHPTTKFYLANMLKAVFMRNVNGGGGFRYINPGPNPLVFDDPATRQHKSPDPSGDYDLGTKQWLDISSMGGPLYFNGAGGQMRLGVNGNAGNPGAIEYGESIVVVPGTDFPSSHFAGFEFREATGDGEKLSVTLYDGMDMVGSFMTTGVNENFNLFYGSRPFDKVVISGTVAGESLAGVGRPSVRVMSAFPSCSN